MSNRNSAYIVTGASRGLGREIALLSAKKGAPLFLIARESKDLESIKQQCLDINRDVYKISADLGSSTDLRTTINIIESELPKDISKLYHFNNASIIEPISEMKDLEYDNIDNLIKVNLTAAFYLSSRLMSIVNNQQTKLIIANISSGVSKTPIEGWSGYCVSKAGLNMLTNCIIAEAKLHNLPISAVSINPGALDTEMQNKIRSADSNSIPITKKFIKMHTDGHLNKVDEVALKIFDLIEAEPFPQDEFVDFNLL